MNCSDEAQGLEQTINFVQVQDLEGRIGADTVGFSIVEKLPHSCLRS